MKILLRVVVSILGLVLLVALGAFADGAMLPADHKISISGTVAAPPEKVFALITNVSATPTWRLDVKSVTILPKDNGREHWVENLPEGVKMQFLATTTTPVSPAGKAERQVLLEDSPDFGGTWTYDVSPGPSAGTTTLKISEDGFIMKPLYRFMMKHYFGETKNLDDYMKSIQAAATK